MKPNPGREVALRRALLRWFDTSRRDLPWRSRRDPYRVWVSEVMLQQTRVEAVREPYARFLRSFPSLASLARADEADVLAAWSGLGYYRRARLLHAGAVHVTRHHRGRLPRSRELLREVPGIGDYTVAALRSIAFGEREAALDANVTRVVARVAGVRDARSKAGRAKIEAFAATLVDCARPGDVNEAMMDLGSAVCTARIARCASCPLAGDCRAARSADPSAFASPRPRPVARAVTLACALVRHGDRVLFLKRPPGDVLLAGLWDLPSIEVDAPEATDVPSLLRDLVRRRSGICVNLAGPVASVRHDIVGRRIVAHVYEAALARPLRRRLPVDARLLDEAGRRAVALPALPVKILRGRTGPGRRRSNAARAEA